MLVTQFSLSNYPAIQVTDPVFRVLQMMDEYEVQHLPVEKNGLYIGLISKEDLLDADEKSEISAMEYDLIKISALPHQHFLTALKLAADFNLSLVPVVSETKELQGMLTRKELIRGASMFNGVEEPGAVFVLEMDKRNFSFGELTRLIETNNAYITQLNTMSDAATGQLIVTIKINRIEVSDILATLQRYEYSIRYYFGEEVYENELKENYDLLMTYLNI